MTTTTCPCQKHDDGSHTWESSCQEHGRDAIMARLLPVGTPVRSVRHPELTGRIKCHEWTAPGRISPIPYNVDWDNSDRAYETLGWFWIYQSLDSIEAVR
jgi:hypothetical protein